MTESRRSTGRAWVDPDDAPELTGKELDRPDGVWRIGGKRVSPERGKVAFRKLLGKTQVNMMLDKSVVAHFKAKAGGRGYQTLINRTLHEAMDREELETTLRRVVREELKRS